MNPLQIHHSHGDVLRLGGRHEPETDTAGQERPAPEGQLLDPVRREQARSLWTVSSHRIVWDESGRDTLLSNLPKN